MVVVVGITGELPDDAMVFISFFYSLFMEELNGRVGEMLSAVV